MAVNVKDTERASAQCVDSCRCLIRVVRVVIFNDE